MLTNAYLLAKIGADTAENEQHFAEILPIGRRVASHGSAPRCAKRSSRARVSAAIFAGGPAHLRQKRFKKNTYDLVPDRDLWSPIQGSRARIPNVQQTFLGLALGLVVAVPAADVTPAASRSGRSAVPTPPRTRSSAASSESSAGRAARFSLRT